MRLSPGQVAAFAIGIACAIAGPAPAGEDERVTAARRFLEALDGFSLSSARNNASPTFAAEIEKLLMERKSRGYGDVWKGPMGGRAVDLVTATRVPNRSLVRFNTQYEAATLSQELVVECDGRCVVVAFREAPETAKAAAY